MAESTAADFGDLIAGRIAAENVTLASRWLERLRVHLRVEANDVFPSEQLLDHIPALIREVAECIRTPECDAVVANTAIVAKAQELGQLRHTQRASVHQLLSEYRLLGGILGSFVQDELEDLGFAPAAADAMEVLRRLNEAIWLLMQTTVDTFVAEYTSTITSHASRLESFNRMVSHELRQPLGTLMYALPLARAAGEAGDAGKQSSLHVVMERNVARLAELMDQLEVLSRLRLRDPDTPDTQEVDLGAVAWDVARQLRELADARGVTVRVREPLPVIVVDLARLELILVNLVSNAIKYSDPAKPQRTVTVEPIPLDEEDDAVRIAVRDNGLGIDGPDLDTIFGKFVRVHASRDAELGIRGSGLGLSIAAECAEAVGGSIGVESAVGEGTTFLLTLPRAPRDQR